MFKIMTQTQALIDILKQSLKTHRLTYAGIARRLDMSEANVKRMFAKRRFSLDRLEQVCQLMHMEMSDLFVLYEASRQRIDHLTEKQEQELVGDAKLLLVAVSVRNQLSFEDIVGD
jgi:DNA-binding Xre family transcriptional regulator